MSKRVRKDGVFIGLAGLLLGISPGLRPREIPRSSPASPRKTPSFLPLLLRLTQYVGPTNSGTERWANTKSKCLASNKEGTGLEKHFKDGCSVIQRPNLDNLKISLLEHYDTTLQLLESANHQPGPGCVCRECNHLKEVESKWIHRLGTLHGQFGLNNRLELHTKSRAAY